MIKVNIGCGNKKYSGWININKTELDLTKESDWKKYFKESDIDRILLEHVFEHLDDKSRISTIENFKRFVKPQTGIIRIAVPDGNHPSKDYIDQVKVGGSGKSADDHKFLYTIKTLTELFSQYGFSSRPLEYFDEVGNFSFNTWSKDDGYIKRSSRFDKRNKKNKLSYTSLIVDFKMRDL